MYSQRNLGLIRVLLQLKFNSTARGYQESWCPHIEIQILHFFHADVDSLKATRRRGFNQSNKNCNLEFEHKRISRCPHQSRRRFSSHQWMVTKSHLQNLLVQGYLLVEERGMCIDQKKSYGPTKSSPKGRWRASVDGPIRPFGVSPALNGFP